jgi:hypothetical protein
MVMCRSYTLYMIWTNYFICLSYRGQERPGKRARIVIDNESIRIGCSVYAAYTQRTSSVDAASLYRYAASTLGQGWIKAGCTLK